MVKVWCLRCPDHAMDHCKPGEKDIYKCTAVVDLSQLWCNFPEIETCDPTKLLINPDLCRELIQDLTEDHKQIIANPKIKTKDIDRVYDQLKEKLHKNHGQAITKQHLEYAYQTAKASPKSFAPTFLAATPEVSKLQTDKAVTTKLGNLNLKDAAPQPQQNASNTSTTETSTTATYNAATPSAALPTGGIAAPATDGLSKHVQPASVIGASRPPKKASNAPTTHVFTNHFTIDLKAGNKLYEYQLVGLMNGTADLSRSKKKVMIKRKIENTDILRNNQDKFACNDSGRIISWKELYPNAQLNDIVDNVPVDDYDRNQQNVVQRQIKIDVVFKRIINLDDVQKFARGTNRDYQETGAASALDVLISRGVRDRQLAPGASAIIRIGDNRFFIPTEVHDFNRFGLIAIRGYSSSVQPVDGSLRLNVNTALSAFYRSQKVSTTIEACGTNQQIFSQRPDLQKHLIGLRVRIMYDRCKVGEVDKSMDTEARRTKTITGFSSGPAMNTMFTDRENNRVSVWHHFQTNYPAAASSSNPRQICVNTSDTTPGGECFFMPDQLEIIPGQLYRKTLDRLDPTMPGQMITWSCRPPGVNKGMIEQSGLAALGLSTGQPGLQILRTAGMSVERTMLRVPSRQIPRPVIQYGQAKTAQAQPNGSSWLTRGMIFLNQNTKLNHKMIQFILHPTSNPEPPAETLRRTAANNIYMTAFMNSFQLNLSTRVNAQRRHATMPIDPTRQGSAALATTLRSIKADLFVLILPDAGPLSRQRHANFRITTDQLLGAPSIVMCEERIIGSVRAGGPVNPQSLIPYIANNAMKVNVRLGNENHTVKDGFNKLFINDRCDTLVLGADLVHPKASAANVTPTIAALVGSVSKTFGKFTGSVRRQTAGEEIISSANMVEMVTERIEAWKKVHGSLPARILYYRDGTGASQYDGIRQEINDIKTAWKKMRKDSNAEVQVTAVVAVKRHNTRLYPIGPPTGKKGNCVPGTVVDSHITSPYYFDFYLQSHEVMEGSAKPTHYFVLENGMDFTEHELQNLTNNFCYVFSHSNSAVSYVAPAYFADKLCERAMLYLHHFNDNRQEISGMSSDAARQSALDAAWQRGQNNQTTRKNPWHPNLDDKMFWM